MTPAAEQRLQAHVRSIVRRASVSREVADDLADEMLGHLRSRCEALLDRGATEEDAVRTAILEFGAAETIGRELGRTYHTRLWASTIGVLLTAHQPASTAPRAIGALRLLIGFEAVLWVVVAVVALIGDSPGRALVALAGCSVFVGSAAVALRGLATGQAWAVWFSMGLALLIIGFGVIELSQLPPGTMTIPVNAVAAAAILAWLAGSWERVRRFVAGSAPIGRRLEMGLAAALIGPALIGAALPSIPDPTQATASDVDMQLSMACGRRDEQLVDGALLRDRPYADLSVEFLWRRSDVLPLGLSHLLGSSEGGGDTAGFRVIDPAPVAIENGGSLPSWMLDKPDPSITVVETGEVAGWFGATSPSLALIPDTMGSFTVGIDVDRIEAGRTIRIGWSLGPTTDASPAWPRAEVAYAHLDRFVLLGQVGCGERTTGGAGRRPAPAQHRFLP